MTVRGLAPLAAAMLAFGLVGAALAEPLGVVNTRYLCDRDVEVPATFVTGPEDGVVVLHLEGNQILLYQEPAASGARYAWPSGGASYVLHAKGQDATILWREAGSEAAILTCTAQM